MIATGSGQGGVEIRDAAGGCRLHVRAHPGARRTSIAGVYGGALKVAVAAQPVRGKANAAICEVVAGALGIPVSRVKVASGPASRDKTLSIEGLGAAEAARRLGEALESAMTRGGKAK